MKKQKFLCWGVVFWILGGMALNGYHHHRESTEASMAKPCCVCKVQNQNTATPAKEIALKTDLAVSHANVVLSYLAPHRVLIRWDASPRDPPISSC